MRQRFWDAARRGRGIALLCLVLCGAAPLWAVERARVDSAVQQIYERSPGQLFWLSGGHLSPAGNALLAELETAANRGLRPADYQVAHLLEQVQSLERGAATPVALAALDQGLSRATAAFVTDLKVGRVRPEDAGYALVGSRTPLDLPAALAALAGSADVAATLDGFEPRYRHYALLKKALARYRELAALPQPAPLAALRVRSVKPGEPYADAPALRSLLERLGDLAPASTAQPPLLDQTLATGVAAFQVRHGLGADGVLGASTWRALTVPLATRVRQIELSMERARWLPPPPGGPFILVNIPAFRLFAFRGPDDREQAMTSMNVIVGQSFQQKNTPVFMADLRYVVFRPYWDVPTSITRKEILPHLRKDLAWGEKEGFELVRGQSDTSPVVPLSAAALDAVARGELRVRQRSGKDNALGLVKFMLPNRYDVYLHSTPAQRLFSQPRRAFSHGCVRVEDPVGLAQFVFAPDSSWTAERITAEMNAGGPPERISLQAPMPVVMYYATALAAEDGRVFFYNDIYRHDGRLEQLLGR
jgi:murein L,D-transpeptidase YcbB/YkuD